MGKVIAAAVAGLIVGAVAVYAWSAINLTKEREQIRRLQITIEKEREKTQQARDELAEEQQKAVDVVGMQNHIVKIQRDLERMTKSRDDYRTRVGELYEKNRDLERRASQRR